MVRLRTVPFENLNIPSIDKIFKEGTPIMTIDHVAAMEAGELHGAERSGYVVLQGADGTHLAYGEVTGGFGDAVAEVYALPGQESLVREKLGKYEPTSSAYALLERGEANHWCG
ncbi:hypothetical protein HOC01_00430 [archaeon]|jgi:hypothetical protein|nr:hypothetical protein [archaeon]MBT6698694.1 hypothetical protein [archaeon]